MRAPYVVALALAACGPPLPDHGSAAAGAGVVTFEPSAEPNAVSSVVHIHIASSSLGAGDVSLFQGALSDYYLGKVRHGEVPDALANRQIGLLSWRSEGELVVAPLQSLPVGPYSLAAPSGLVAEFQVASELPVMRRVWPPVAGGSPRFAVYCGDRNALPNSSRLMLEPGELPARLAAGVDADGAFADRCLNLSVNADLPDGEIVVPPAVGGDYALDPAPFSAGGSDPAVPLGCADGEIALGVGCASVADDRAIVRTPVTTLFWVLHTARGASVEVTRAGAPLAVRGLSPSSREHVWGSVHDESGTELAFDPFVETGAARARPVLNEVLANPLGPEPQAEWIEVVNDGSLALDLSGYTLQDSGGSTPLPHALLAPQEYALLVRDDFVQSTSDVAPPAGTHLIRMPMLGKSGLSNSGERLALLDSNGQECSAVPALATKAGQSLARRYPWSLDADPQSFSYGTATPGTENTAGTQ